ncbi:MAG: HAD family hydrolase, partial [Mesorhizobium sp.]
MADIKGILFDKDGTLVDFNATWLGVADFMA